MGTRPPPCMTSSSCNSSPLVSRAVLRKTMRAPECGLSIVSPALAMVLLLSFPVELTLSATSHVSRMCSKNSVGFLSYQLPRILLGNRVNKDNLLPGGHHTRLLFRIV